jgi:hypothetical protein
MNEDNMAIESFKADVVELTSLLPGRPKPSVCERPTVAISRRA